MSHRATTWAWQQQNLPALQKLVLLALADRHNNDTGRCDPSMQLVAEDCGMSRDSVKRAIKGLQESGLITAQERKVGTTNISNYYTLNLTPVGANSTGGGCSQHRGVGAISPTNLEVELGIESGNQTASEALFPLEEKCEEKSPIEDVFAYYMEKIAKHPKLYTLTERRRRMGLARWKEACRKTNGDRERARFLMEAAIDALAADDFYNARGKHEGKTKFNDWEIIFRSTEQFEKFLERSNG